jgi:glycosyltransferase involved in cell wall biosynthesis
MRVLLLSTELPSTTAFSGGATRMFQMYQRLIDHGHSVTVIAPVGAGREQDLEDLKSGGWSVVPYRRPAGRLTETLGQILRHPMLLIDALRLPTLALQSRVLWLAMRADAQAELDGGDYDLVSIQHDYAAPWLADLTGVPTSLLELHNLTSEYARLSAQETRGPARWKFLLDARRYERLVDRFAPAFDELTFISNEEQRLLEDRMPELALRRMTFPAGANLEDFATERADSGEPVVLMTGTMSYPPNAEGALWFAREIWPQVRAKVPDAVFVAAGRDPLPKLRDLNGNHGIEVTGTISSILPYFERAALCVVPLRTGAGQKLKVGEAFAASRAVVTTSVGASGIGAEDGRDFVVADDADRFAAAVIDLLRDRDRRTALARSGRAYAVEHFDWESIGDKFTEELERLAATGPAGSL